MAIRRLNFTGRQRLRQHDVHFVIEEQPTGAARFRAKLAFDNCKLPGNADVFVEAYRQTTWMRFRFGSVANPQPVDEPVLTDFDSVEGILFRVRVTSPFDNKGVLLAEADRIRPRLGNEDEESNRVPLLTVRSDNTLGDEIWRVDFTDRPTLLINAAVGDWRALAKQPVFVACVYPIVLRTVLSRIVYVDKYFETDDCDDWRSQWLQFALLLPGTLELPTDDDTDACDHWIDCAVEAFCRQSSVMSHFRTWWSGEKQS